MLIKLDTVVSILSLQEAKMKATVKRGESTKAFLAAREEFVAQYSKESGLTPPQVRDLLRMKFNT